MSVLFSLCTVIPGPSVLCAVLFTSVLNEEGVDPPIVIARCERAVTLLFRILLRRGPSWRTKVPASVIVWFERRVFPEIVLLRESKMRASAGLLMLVKLLFEMRLFFTPCA